MEKNSEKYTFACLSLIIKTTNETTFRFDLCLCKIKFYNINAKPKQLEGQIYKGIIDGKRGSGRPRRWSQDLTDRIHINVTGAGHCAQDRDVYRRTAKEAACQEAPQEVLYIG